MSSCAAAVEVPGISLGPKRPTAVFLSPWEKAETREQEDQREGLLNHLLAMLGQRVGRRRQPAHLLPRAWCIPCRSKNEWLPVRWLKCLSWLLLAALAHAADPPVAGYRVLARHPHDPQAFTQGLVWVDGVLYEGTGLYGRSAIRRLDLETGRIEQETRLPPQFFGEGIAYWQGQLIQLTWREERGLIYDASSLKLVASFAYPGEGWGLTQDGTHWIASDGTETLRFIDPKSRRFIRLLRVHAGDRPISHLNELEWIEGEIWANVWQRDQIIRIDPQDGRVTGILDLSALYPQAERQNPEAVLNGIAYDPQMRRIFVTGKYWPWLYAIQPAQ